MISRIIRSLNAIIIGHLIARVGSLLLVPLFLRYWSATAYGEYLAIFALVTYFSTIDLGISQATINRLTQAFTKEDRSTYGKVYQSGLLFYVGMSLFATLILVLAGNYLPLAKWMGFEATPHHIASKVIIVIGICTIWGMPIRFIFNTSRTVGNLAFTQWIMNVHQLLTLLLICIAILGGGGMLEVSIVQALGLAIMAILYMGYLKIKLGWIKLGFSQAESSQVWEVSKLGMPFYALTVCNLLTFQGSTLLVATSLGGIAVASFSVSRTLASFIRTGVDALSLAFWPEITRLDATEQLQKLRTVHRLILGGCLIISVGAAGAMWFEGATFIRLWTGGRLEADEWFLRAIVAMAILQVPWLAGYSVAAATNRLHKLMIAYCGSSIIGIVLASILVSKLGVIGVPIGLGLAEVSICSYFILKNTCKLLGESYVAFASRIWGALAIVTVISFFASWCIHRMLAGEILLVRGGVVTVVSFTCASICTWMFWFDGDQRGLLIDKASSFWPELSRKNL